jgi:LysR family nitrogen assimilation transcriptional regulator
MKGFLDTRRMRYFKAIADHGSLSAAARSLRVAQPALSYHIIALENLIGVHLLNRRHDGVTLTEAGKLLLRHANEIVAQVDRAETELLRIAGDRRSKIKVRLAVISSLAADLTPILVGAVSKEMPEVILRITESGTLDSQELLDQGKADVAVYLAGPGNGGGSPLALERLFLVSASDHEEPATPITFAEVTELRLVMPAMGNPLRLFVENAAAEVGRSLNVALEVDGAGPRRNAILAGLGNTIFGGHSVFGAERQAGLVVRPIIEPTMFRPIHFGTRRGLDPAIVARIRRVLARSLASFGGVEVDRCEDDRITG